jgi:hypothetical protein
MASRPESFKIWMRKSKCISMEKIVLRLKILKGELCKPKKWEISWPISRFKKTWRENELRKRRWKSPVCMMMRIGNGMRRNDKGESSMRISLRCNNQRFLATISKLFNLSLKKKGCKNGREWWMLKSIWIRIDKNYYTGYRGRLWLKLK